MKILKSHFEIHKRFRNGILVLSILIFLLLLGFFLYPQPKSTKTHFEELAVFQSQIDALKKKEIEKTKAYKRKPFNPNFITEYKGYVLGLSADELDRLHTYRKQNKWINSIADFKKVTRVSDSLLTVIAPLFKFPDWIKNAKKNALYEKKKLPVLSYVQKEDLNSVTSVALQEKIGVPDFIAERIIRYRGNLEGFISDIQLKDVKGLYESQRKKILSLYTVKTGRNIEKVNINNASVKELMEVPYFDFETALEIRDYIEVNKGIQDFKELGEIEGFFLEKTDRIALYLKLN